MRLLLPITIPSHLSVWNLLHTSVAAQADGVISDVLTPFPSLATNSTAEPAADITGISPMLLIWLVCAILLAAYFAVGYACMVRQFRGTRLAPQPSIDALLDRFRFSRDPHICVSNSRRAPLTFGVFRPTVLLPEDLPVGDAQFQLVLAHELAHIRRKDCLRKLLLTVCLCLYWWNPLVWMMVWLANRDMELACDEAVLRALGPDCRKAYALTLLDMAQRNQNQRRCAVVLQKQRRRTDSRDFKFQKDSGMGWNLRICSVRTDGKCLYNAGSKPGCCSGAGARRAGRNSGRKCCCERVRIGVTSGNATYHA
ncbi:MAG: M56 family metallopeptidase [Oscillospiraceae bacterium]